MQIFLSWSGELSKQIATIFYNWLPSVLQNVTPYLSAEDIDKGEKWINSISENLNDTSIGVIFVTKENVTAPWINYEAGALSNSLEATNVCPLLIDMSKGDIDSRNPLFHYQATCIEKDDILKLLKTINRKQKDMKISESALNKAFEWAWSDLHNDIKKVLESFPKVENALEEIENKNGDVEEILAIVRSLKKEQRDSEYEQNVINLRKKNEELVFMLRNQEKENFALREEFKKIVNSYRRTQEMLEELKMQQEKI